jgi:hypothetical protein
VILTNFVFISRTSTSLFVCLFLNLIYFNAFLKLCDRKKKSKSKSISLTTRLFQLPIPQNSLIPQNLRGTGSLFTSAMDNYWCQCNTCEGGKPVSRRTWYRHRKEMCMREAYLHIPGSTPVRRKLSPDLAGATSKSSDAGEPDDPHPADVIEQSPRSWIVSFKRVNLI